eukprot:Lankesteria_metandrocarpae@DN10513_c0_g1_i1.p1
MAKQGSDPQGFLTNTEWGKFVETIWSGPETVVMHTVILPDGFVPTATSLRQARVVEEKRYRLPAGMIPQISKRPCNFFEANVDSNCNPSKCPVPPNFVVMSTAGPNALNRQGTHRQFLVDGAQVEE